MSMIMSLAAAQKRIAELERLAELWRKKYEYIRNLHLVRDGSKQPTDGEIASAIKATEYKYFGDYEMSDEQRDAVDVLVTAAQHMATARAEALREAAELVASCSEGPWAKFGFEMRDRITALIGESHE